MIIGLVVRKSCTRGEAKLHDPLPEFENIVEKTSVMYLMNQSKTEPGTQTFGRLKQGPGILCWLKDAKPFMLSSLQSSLFTLSCLE